MTTDSVTDTRRAELRPPIGGSRVADQRGSNPGVSRRALAVGMACAAVALAVAIPAGGTVWIALLLAALVATSLVPDTSRPALALVAWLPAGLVGAVAIGATVLLATRPLQLLAGPSWLTRSLPLLLVVLAPLALAAVRGGRVHLVAGQWPAAIAGLGVLSIEVGAWLFQDKEVWLRSVANGTDFSRHLTYTKELMLQGGLDYTVREYPRALHSLVSTIWGPQGPPTYLEGWIGLEGVLWLLVVLMAVAGTVIITQLGRRMGVAPVLSNLVGTSIFLLVLLQSMWVTAMFRNGFATSLLVGLVLLAVLAVGLEPHFLSSRRGLLVVTGGLVVLLHTWALLAPSLGLAFALVWWLNARSGQSRVILIAVPVIGALAALPAVLGMLRSDYRGLGLQGQLNQIGDSGLAAPQWYWFVLAALAAVQVVTGLGVERRWSLLWVALALPALLMTGFLVLVNGESWPELGYYSLKTVWTASALILPVGIAGGLFLLHLAIRRASSIAGRRRRQAAQIALLSVVVLGVAATAGWLAGTPRLWPQVLQTGGGFVPLQIPVVEALEEGDVRAEPGQPALVWGLAPYGDIDSIQIQGSYDWFGTEAAAYRGFEIEDAGLPFNHLRRRAADQVCEYLVQHPEAVKITGPNPEPGLGWLTAAGCPTEVTDPATWIVVDIPDQWFVGLQPPGLDYVYPSWSEYEAALSGGRERTGEEPEEAPGNDE